MSNALRLSKVTNRAICWRRLDANDYQAAVSYIRTIFPKNSPLRQGMNATEEETSAFVDYALKDVKNWQAICAYDQASKDILGLAMVSGPQQTRDMKFLRASPESTERQKQVERAFSKLTDGIPEQIKDERNIKGEFVVTHPECAEWGVASALTERMLWSLKEQGHKRMLVASTSCFTTRLLENLGAVCLNQIRFAEYKDPVTGERIFSGVPPPHNALKLMCNNL